jgi:hypothetical protein
VPETNQKIIFITGASRSGTTLMSFILRNHSQIFGLKETHYFGEFWDPGKQETNSNEHQLVSGAAAILARQEQGILAARPTKTDLARANEFVEALPVHDRTPESVFANVTKTLALKAGKTIPCEQTPRNIFYADALLKTYPNARIVHMMRDPRAVMASQKKRWQRRRLTTDTKGFPLAQSLRVWVNYHPYTIARLWNRASQAAISLKSHPRFTLVRFEDLLEEPEKVIRSLCDDIDVGYEQTMLEVGQINSSHQSSVGGARKGLHKNAIDTWKSTLSGSDVAITERLCNQLMKQFGYTTYHRLHSAKYNEIPYMLSYLLHLLGVLIVNPRRAWIQFKAMPASLGKQQPCKARQAGDESELDSHANK